MTINDSEHGILGVLLESSTKLLVQISDLIGLRSSDKNKLHTINYANLKSPFPLAAYAANGNHYIISYLNEQIPRTKISFRRNNLIISPGTVSQIELDIHQQNSRIALNSLHNKVVTNALTNDGFERARTLGGRDKSKLASKELIDTLCMDHSYTDFETGKREIEKVNYELHKAIKKSMQILPSGNMLVTLNPSTIIIRDGYVPYTYYQLPNKVIRKFNPYWRMTGFKALKESEYPSALIGNEFENRGFSILNSGIIHFPLKIIQLPPPKFVFGKKKKLVLEGNQKTRELIKLGLKSFGPIYKPRKLKILVATDTIEMIDQRKPPKYFSSWPFAFKKYIKLIRRKLVKGDKSLFHVNSVDFVGPVYLKGDPKSYLSMLRDLAKKESVDAILYIIAEYKKDKTGMHDLIKEYVKDVPTKCILIKKLKKHTPKSKEGYSPLFLQIADDLVIGLYYAATRYFPWSIESKHFDSVVGIDVRRDKQTRYYCITLTLFTNKGLIRISNGNKMKKGENIPISALTDSIEKLILRVKERNLTFQNTLFLRDGFDFTDEKEAVKDILDKHKIEGTLDEKHQWIYCQIIKNPELRVIHSPSLDEPSRWGQPSRGIAFVLADLPEWKEGYIVTTGYPDIGKKTKSKASNQGLSQPIFVRELERSTNNSTTFPEVLETIYHRTYLNPSLTQIRVPIEIPAAEKYMEYLSYGLSTEEIPGYLG